MIVDVHTHAPRQRTAPATPTADIPSSDRAAMRPDRPDPAGVTWDDYLAAMAVVDRAIVFNIASPPPGDPDPLSAHLTGSVFEAPARAVNDNTAALVRAYPDKLIGFLSVHPRDPAMDDELDRGDRRPRAARHQARAELPELRSPQRRGVPALRPRPGATAPDPVPPGHLAGAFRRPRLRPPAAH